MESRSCCDVRQLFLALTLVKSKPANVSVKGKSIVRHGDEALLMTFRRLHPKASKVYQTFDFWGNSDRSIVS